jgi:hypothetical protein
MKDWAASARASLLRESRREAPDPQAAEAAAVGAFNLSENRPERG